MREQTVYFEPHPDNGLGPEMRAERWHALSTDPEDLHIFWLHPPSQRCVDAMACKRSEWKGPTFGMTEPASPDTPGYCVTTRRHDEHGNPYEGAGLWVESYGQAIRIAREMRRHILDEKQPMRRVGREQLTLDDALHEVTEIKTGSEIGK